MRYRWALLGTRVHLLGVLSIMSCTSAALRTNAATAPTPPVSSRVALASLLQQHGYVAVPLTHPGNMLFTSGLYTLEIAIDTTPVTVLFDSGNNQNIALHRSLADSVGIRGTFYQDVVGVGGGIAADTTHTDRFTLRGMPLGSQFVKIAATLDGHAGALGAVFASAYHAMLDYTTNVLYVQRAGQPSFPLPPGVAEQQGEVAIPLQRVATGTPLKVIYLVHATVDTRPVTLLLDTGADGYLTLDQARADSLGLRTTSAGSAQGTGGNQAVQNGVVHRFALGRLQLDSLPYIALDLSVVQHRYQQDGLPPIDGVLAAGVLVEHGAIIDFGQGMLYLHRQPSQ